MMNSLTDPRVAGALETLYAEAARDGERWAARREQQARDTQAGTPAPPESLVRMGEFYLGVSRQEGELLYLLARSSKANCIVEFGASYGISTLYLGAAARDNGGRLITTEVHPDKCRATRQTLADAGLKDSVTLLEGDALITLGDVTGPIDLVLLDGWKSLYLPVLELLRPKLAVGALVAADNIDHEAAQDYVAAIRSPRSGFFNVTFGEMELSCFAG